MHLSLDLNDFLKVDLTRLAEDDETHQKSTKKHTELLIELIDRKSTKASALARKVIRWPIGQTLPTQIAYNNGDEQLLIVGPTSEALLPMPKSKIDALTATAIAKSGPTTKTKTFSSFAVNPIDTFDTKSLLKSIQNCIENPEKEKRWKQLSSKLDEECSNGEAAGALSAVEQSQLLTAIRRYTDDVDSEPETLHVVLKAIATSRVLSFRNEDGFLRMCIEKLKSNTEIVEHVLADGARVVSEFILAELLKLAAGKPSESERRAQVSQVLARNFSKIPMTEACGAVLSVTESIEIMTILTEIYRESPDISISSKALTLITVLMDAHGSRIVYEDKLHHKFAAISNFIIEMQSLVGTFARLEAAIDECSDTQAANNVVIRMHPVAHPINW